MTTQWLANALRPALALAILPALGGCMVHARAVPATATYTATALAVQPIAQPVMVAAPQPVYISYAPPPPPRSYVVQRPAARPGYVWVGGHHSWTGHGYRWRAGHWVASRGGAVWVAPRYSTQRQVYVRGHWLHGGAQYRSAAPRVIVRNPAPLPRVVVRSPRRPRVIVRPAPHPRRGRVVVRTR